MLLVGAPSSTIRVGDGSAAGAGFTATIASALTGESGLRKTDLGTLVLDGANGYSGGTAIDGGVLQVVGDANLGAAAGGLSLDTGTLRTTASFASARAVTLGVGGGTLEPGAGTELALEAGITGAGGLTKAGQGTLLLTGDSSYSGGTRIAAGQLRLGDGGTSGSVAGDVIDEGTLVFDRSDALAFAGGISGSGAVQQVGSGTTTLAGPGRYSGVTTVVAGTLAGGATGAFSPASAYAVAAGARLDLADFGQRVGSIANAGRVSLGAVPGTRLTVRRTYAGAGGVLRFAAKLGGDASPTDRMQVLGGTSGSSIVEVTNVGGAGAPTVEGIRIIEVGGASDGEFTLAGDYLLNGRPVVAAGAYGYVLEKNGVTDPADGDWYLRSQLATEPPLPPEPLPPEPLPPEPLPPEPLPPEPVPPGPPLPEPVPPIFQPGVPVYQAYAATLLALNGLPTMQERIGNRFWGGAGVLTDGVGPVDDRGVWARIDGGRSHLEPDVATGSDAWDIDGWGLQVGIDRPVWGNDDGLLVGGVSFHYGQVDTDVSSAYGDGSISTEGYGLGGSLTWFGNDGVYVDGQAALSWYDSDLHSATLGADLAHGNDGFGVAAGIEAGKRIALRGDWTVTPQAQLIYASVDFDSFTDPLGAQVSAGDGQSLPGRLGVSVDQERAWRGAGGEKRTHFYGIANLEYQFLDSTGVDVSGTALTATGDRLWGSLGVGGTYSWDGGTNSVYGEGLVATSLSNFADSTSNRATFGFRRVW